MAVMDVDRRATTTYVMNKIGPRNDRHSAHHPLRRTDLRGAGL